MCSLGQCCRNSFQISGSLSRLKVNEKETGRKKAPDVAWKSRIEIGYFSVIIYCVSPPLCWVMKYGPDDTAMFCSGPSNIVLLNVPDLILDCFWGLHIQFFYGNSAEKPDIKKWRITPPQSGYKFREAGSYN